MSEQLPDNVMLEMESKNIAVADRIVIDDFNKLSPTAKMAVVKAKITVFDGPQPKDPKAIPRSRFDSYSEAEQWRLREAGYYVTD